MSKIRGNTVGTTMKPDKVASKIGYDSFYEDINGRVSVVEKDTGANKTAINEHITNLHGDNPHGVTCEQIGAVTQKEFRDVVSNLDGSNDPGELIPHLLNRDNPHGVTCEQIGAVAEDSLADNMYAILGEDFANDGPILVDTLYPLAETAVYDTLYDFGLINYDEDSGDDTSHAHDTNNPHGVTAAQAGAAPVGYGLGETSSRSTNNWADAVNSFKRGNTGSPDGEWWHGLVCKEYGNITTNLAFKPNNGVWLSAMRGRTSNGNWCEWEYINPPMVLDVEYRTIERVNGAALYTTLVGCGAAANGATVDLNKFNISSVVRFNAYVMGTALPRINSKDFSNPWSIYVNAHRTAIEIYCGSEQAGKQVYCQIWYTKV